MSEQLRERVRRRYADAAATVTAGGAGCCGDQTATVLEPDERFGSALYGVTDKDTLPIKAVAASLGCGNPTAVADLHAGERVLDLGSGGGIDVILSANRVGPTGFVYGVDMTAEMLELARANAAEAKVRNVEFLQGTIENVPLPDAAVDVVISNCVINLSVDKPAVIAEMFRVLAPGGRIVVVDFAPHELEFLREQHAHRRLGFAREQVAGWLEDAGLAADSHTLVSPSGDAKGQLTVSLWVGRDRRPAAVLRQPDRETA